MLRHGAHAGLVKHGSTLAAVFEAAQQAQNGRRIGFFAAGGDMREDFLYCPELFRFVINDEVSLVTKLLDVLPKDAHAERMERGYRRRGGFAFGVFWAPR